MLTVKFDVFYILYVYNILRSGGDSASGFCDGAGGDGAACFCMPENENKI